MTQAVSADYEVMLSYAERIDAMATQLETVTTPALTALGDGTIMSSMSQGLGPIGAPFTAAYMAGMTNHCVNSMEIAAGMHAHAEAIRESAEQYAGTDELHAAALEAEQTMNEDLAQGKDLLGKTMADPNLGQAVEAALPAFLKDQLDPSNQVKPNLSETSPPPAKPWRRRGSRARTSASPPNSRTAHRSCSSGTRTSLVTRTSRDTTAALSPRKSRTPPMG